MAMTTAAETAAAGGATNGAGGPKTLSERADELEEQMLKQLDKVPSKSPIYTSGEVDPRVGNVRPTLQPGQYMLMGDDPRLPKMPAKPTLLDFFEYRFGPAQHLLQSAAHARDTGQPEKIQFACLVHDIAVLAFIRGDHGYWGAQLVEPYVDEEVSWAMRAHQALRFYPDEAVGYGYPDSYIKNFGADYRPDPYIEAE